MESGPVRTVLAAAAVFLVGCSPPKDAGPVLNRGNGPDITSLDPAYIRGNWEAWVVGDLIVGLTTDGPRGEPIPGIATHWETSRDGLVWTFHLRKALWSDGMPVTAEDFVTAWRRLLDPKTAAPYAYNLWVVKNAQAISSGKLPPSALGVRAVDDKTLTVTLAHPVTYLPQLMDHQVAWPIPRHIYLKLGQAWSRPKHYIGDGPYKLKAWVPGDRVTLVKNPLFYDARHVRIQTVNYYQTDNSEAALREFRVGQLDTLDPFPNAQIGWMRKHIPQALKIAPYLGLSYYAMNFTRKPFQDIRLREAINLAFDREVLTGKIHRIGETPAYRIVPPGVADYPGTAALWFESLPFAQRLAKAQDLMRAMGYGPGRHLRLGFLTSTNPDAIRNAVAFQAMMAKIGIDISIVSVEGQVFQQMVQKHEFDIAAPSWIADFNDASNFLDLLRSGSGENYGAYSNPKYDALLDEAEAMTDAAARGKKMQEAEQLALSDYVWVPAYFMVTRDLVQPYVKGWLPNVRDVNQTRWLRIDKR
ncbi:MAG: peptide ABC transporter substrate-binding protein [Alphaproteobacteria bacterium]|nr:peptide ABC transporter substrate-binding protein [Alphaproteobacteria bacterium]MDE2111632.1 peptide ABC transporter substrate-binding protein [Alphaproteobacteria bacterium]MDE2494240.1 peptide ABC transporter substrate-binding protein [Alphaproteobacteria bacterium]